MEDSKIDNLMSHVVDGSSTDKQWEEFVALAEADPKLWRDLAETQRDHVTLGRAMSSAAAVADRVVLPEGGASFGGLRIAHALAGTRRVGAWGGWAAAAMVTVALLLQFGQTAQSPPSGVQKAGLGLGSYGVDELWNAYIENGTESGDVIRELPTKVLVDSRPAPSGEGYEVLYLRQVLERALVPELYRLDGQDELGQPTFARYEAQGGNSL